MIGAWTAIDFSAAQMDEDKNIGIANAPKRQYAFGEEIRGDDGLKVSVYEGRPRDRRFLGRLVGLGKVTPYGQIIPPNSKVPVYRGFLRFPAGNLDRLNSRLLPRMILHYRLCLVNNHPRGKHKTLCVP